MFDDPLSLPTRITVTLSVCVFAIHARRALTARVPSGDGRTRLYFLWGASALALGIVFSHLPSLRPLLAVAFPAGAAIGLVAAIATFASATMRARFDALTDADVRSLLGYRAWFGALIFALTALGHFPRAFAMTAGLGDLLVGALAMLAPASLDPSSTSRASRLVRLVVHGVALADLLQVAGMAMLVVRPWSAAHGDAATSMTLPWVLVPFMFAFNLHGIRQVFAANAYSGAPPTGPRRDGPESARCVRRALQGA